MSKNKKQLEFLSQSVLLEEGGLPRLNIWIIVMVFLAVTAFIAWAMVLEINDAVQVEGVAVQVPYSNEFSVEVMVPSAMIGEVAVGASTILRIKGVTDKRPALGEVASIDRNPSIDSQGQTVYKTIVNFVGEEAQLADLQESLLPGMAVKTEIVTGQRSLLQYLLGPVFSAKEKALK